MAIRAGFVLPIVQSAVMETSTGEKFGGFRSISPSFLIALGYRFNRYFSLEIEQHIGRSMSGFLQDEVRSDVNTRKGDFYASYLLARGMIPVSKYVSIPVTLGGGLMYGESFIFSVKDFAQAGSAKAGAGVEFRASGFILNVGVSYVFCWLARAHFAYTDVNNAKKMFHYIEPEITVGWVF